MDTTANNGSERDSISVFFPCYNEQGNLLRIYRSASEILGKSGLDYEIILVDDGSKDQTLQIANAIATADPKVKIIHHPTNLGYGAALQSGFRAASKRLVFYTDGDGQFSLNELPQLLPLMARHDIVSCFRLNRQEGFFRKFNGWCWTSLVCLVFNLRIRDINCAFKIYKRNVFETMELRSTGALINSEILARATRRGLKITQVGVHHFPRIQGQPTGSNFAVILRAFREMVTFYKHINNDTKV